MNDPTDQYTEPPEQVRREMDRTLTLRLTSARAILDTLRQMDEFLRCHAGPAVRAELDAFCATRGWNTDALLDGVGLHALTLNWAIDTAIDSAIDHPATTDHHIDHDKETA